MYILIYFPCEFALFHGNGVEGELDTHIADGADIGEEFLIVIGRDGDLIWIKEVGRQAVVEVNGTA